MKYKSIQIKIVLALGSCFLSLFANAQQLEILIDEALTNNPEIQKFELQYKRASEKVTRSTPFLIPNLVLVIL